MPSRSKITLEGVVPFAVAGILFGLLYNTLFYPRTLVEYTESGAIGAVLGVIAGLAEQTVLERALRQRSLLQAVILRTVLYAVPVAIVLALVIAIEPATLGQCSYVRCVVIFIQGPTFLRDIVFSTVFVFFASFTAQVVLLVGTRNFARLLMGKYRRPHELYAVFMFVDLRSSTSIAEKLGHERYSAFLRDFFNDVSGGIHEAKGEVYQYVGDEVVVVWPGDPKDSHWLACFEAMRDAVKAAAASYQAKYGAIPEFKAGVHGGEVVVTEVGTLQRAHVYHGDVLNAASRIQAKCNETGFDLLASNEVVAGLSPGEAARFQEVGAVALRGKSEEVLIHGLRE